MSTASPYSRLPGRSGLFLSHSLWLTTDHILSVRRNPFSESYRRYYFADIQAIVITELPNVVAPYGYTIGVLLVVTTAALFYSQHPAWGILCALISLATLWASWRSADCACYLQTTVSSEMLPSLRKQSNAAKTLAILKVEIEKTQGAVSADVLEVGPADARSRQPSPQKTVRHSTGHLHWIVFALMVMRASLELPPLLSVASVPLNFAASGLGTVVLVLLIVAAIQQRNSDLDLNVRRMTHLSLVCYLVDGLAAFIFGIYMAVRIAQRSANRAVFLASPSMKSFELVRLIVFCTLGLAGMFFLWRHQQSSAPPSLEPGING